MKMYRETSPRFQETNASWKISYVAIQWMRKNWALSDYLRAALKVLNNLSNEDLICLVEELCEHFIES